jgi:hypothetical protein
MYAETTRIGRRMGESEIRVEVRLLDEIAYAEVGLLACL